MQTIDKVKALLTGQVPSHRLWGEVWIGPDVNKSAGYDESLGGQIALRKYMGMDLIWLPVSRNGKYHTQGYRLFRPIDVRHAKESCDLFVGVVVDGPWQQLVDEMGFMNSIKMLSTDRKVFVNALNVKAQNAMTLVEESLTHGAKGVVVVDDLAGQAGPLLSPDDAGNLLSSFYARTVDIIRRREALALFHSCGNIDKLISMIAVAGFHGLAAVQTYLLMLDKIARQFTSPHLIVAGLDFGRNNLPVKKQIMIDHIKEIEKKSPLILSTSSGIHSWEQASHLIEIYGILTKITV